jgi:hypothetical protein
VKIDEMQCGFMPGKSTTDAMFVVRQLQEKYAAINKELWFAFVDLEKAFDRVPREVVRWALRRKGVSERLVRAVMVMYAKAGSVVRTPAGMSERFDVTVGVHQGSVLSPLLFAVVMDEVVSSVKIGMPFEVLFADDLVLLADSKEALLARFTAWKQAMEAKGMKVNMAKTKVMCSDRDVHEVRQSGKNPCGVCSKGVGSNAVMCTQCNKWVHARCSGIRGRLTAVVATQYVCKTCTTGNINKPSLSNIQVDGAILEAVQTFCYLGDVLECNGGSSAAVTARIRRAWMKWRELAPVLLGPVTPFHLKGLMYRMCVRSALIYGSETWALKVEDLRRLERTEMRMLRWMAGAQLADRKSNEQVRKMLDVETLDSVIRRNRLRWFGHVERKTESHGVKRARDLVVASKRQRGRPRKTWTQTVEADLKTMRITREMAHDRSVWEAAIRFKTSNLCGSEKNGR